MTTRLLLLLASITSLGGANAGRDVCVEGFVMDKFCIDRGTLLDNPSVKTLENPEKHSVHCLVDVSVCYNSGFNILLPNPSGSPAYTHAFRLDDVGNQKVIELARVHGSCSTCKNGYGGTITRGLRGTFFGTVTQEATDSQPATLAVKNVTVSPKTLDPNNMSDGCPRGANKPNVTLSTEASSSETPSVSPGSNSTVSTEASSSETPSVTPGGIDVCVEGFVMDKFCIDRGTLLDNPSVKTLENPEKHTVHCLVDISVCYNSGFNILRPNPSGSPAYTHAFRLDDVGNQKVIEVARANGICSTCGNDGTIRQGFRGTFFGTITQEATDSQPATLAVKNVTVSPKTLDPNNMSDGCPGGANKPNVTLSTEASSSETPSVSPGSNSTVSTEASSSETPSVTPGSIEVCMEGFVMDKFCIDRGTLLDNPSVKTLENPEKHSVHCLVDIFQCYDSGFNILRPNPSGSPAYTHAFRLDDIGNQKVIELARVHGSCSTCENGYGGTITRGFRGTFFGTITQEATDSQPATFAVKNMTVSPKTLDPNNMSDGCPRGANKPNLTISTEASSSETPSVTPGSNPTVSTKASSSKTPSVTPGSIDICVEGFVMDKFCIDRGTLLDNPSVKTLENPEKHSVHCLVDIFQCYDSGFNILRPNPSGSPAYTHAFRLDDIGNQKVIELARVHGSCSTCENGYGGTITRGFRGTFFGTITQEATDSQPATLAVKNVTVSPKTLDPNNMSDGCSRRANKPNHTVSTDAGSLETPSIVHGSLMIICWGFLLPTGVASMM